MELHPPTPKKRGSAKILGTFLLAAAVLAALFVYRDRLGGLLGMGAGGKGPASWERQISTLEEEPGSRQGAGQPPAGELTAPAPPAETPASETISPQDEIKALAEEMLAFFRHLDREEYFLAYQLKEGSQAHFRAILAELFANPPVVARETDDLLNVMHNVAHFFRVLGKQEIALGKEIMQQEDENMELTLAMFYRWSEIADQYRGKELELRLPLPDLYEYAGFFLNTLGGQAYLFRRDPKVRLLVKYYAVLIVDRADHQNANRHGIDIRPAVDSLIEEMNVTQGLHNRQHYLQTLAELQSAYQVRSE